MPDESQSHRRTWMAFGASEQIWEDLLPFIRSNLALVARTISEYEPVSMLVRPEEHHIAARMCGEQVHLVDAPLDDLWLRDSGPTSVVNQAGQPGGVDMNVNGWGNKQECENDTELPRFVTKQARATYLESELVGEGGGIEVDGRGTAIVTESCFLNSNRNPGLSKADCEEVLRSLFGLRRIIWLPGVRGKDITDGHTDF